MKNWKTTIAGFITGFPIALKAISEAYAAGQFNGQTGTALLIGVGMVLVGAYSKDHDVTGNGKNA